MDGKVDSTPINFFVEYFHEKAAQNEVGDIFRWLKKAAISETHVSLNIAFTAKVLV